VVTGRPCLSTKLIVTLALATVGTSHRFRPFLPSIGCKMRATSNSTEGSLKSSSMRKMSQVMMRPVRLPYT